MSPDAKKERGRLLCKIAGLGIEYLAVAWMLVGVLVVKRVRRRKGRDQRIPTDERILVVRLDEIGDMVFTSVFLRNLRRLYPRARITLVAKDSVANLVEQCPYIDELVLHAVHCHRLLRPLVLPLRAIRLARALERKESPTLGIQPRWDTDGVYAGLLLYLLCPGRRIGYSEQVNSRKSLLNKGFDRFYTETLHFSETKHEVEHGQDLIRYLGGTIENNPPEVWTIPQDHRAVESLMLEQGIPNASKLVAVAPGAGHPRRMWPVDRYAALASWLCEQLNAEVLIIGGMQDNVLAGLLGGESEQRVHNLAGRLSLRQTCALLKRCDLFVGNDSGPLHLAAAAGIPVVAISCHPRCGDDSDVQSPVRFGPRTFRSVILQPGTAIPPCRDHCASSRAHCITGVSVESVKRAVMDLCPT